MPYCFETTVRTVRVIPRDTFPERVGEMLCNYRRQPTSQLAIIYFLDLALGGFGPRLPSMTAEGAPRSAPRENTLRQICRFRGVFVHLNVPLPPSPVPAPVPTTFPVLTLPPFFCCHLISTRMIIARKKEI